MDPLRKPFLQFSERLELEDLYKKWVKENDLIVSPLSVITFLCVHDLLHISKAKEYIKVNKGGDLNA